MFETTLQLDTTVALLNNKPHNITQRQFKLLLYVTTAAKQSITKAVKSTTLCVVSVKQHVTQAMIHAKMEAIILYKLSKFEILWLPWITHHLPPDLDGSLLWCVWGRCPFTQDKPSQLAGTCPGETDVSPEHPDDE